MPESSPTIQQGLEDGELCRAALSCHVSLDVMCAVSKDPTAMTYKRPELGKYAFGKEVMGSSEVDPSALTSSGHNLFVTRL